MRILLIFSIPAANTFDLSANMLRYSQWQLDNARAMWKRLEKRIPVGGDGYNELRVMFDSVFGYYVQPGDECYFVRRGTVV